MNITRIIESPKTALIVGMSAVAVANAGMGYGVLTGAGLTAIAYVGSLFERKNDSKPINIHPISTSEHWEKTVKKTNQGDPLPSHHAPKTDIPPPKEGNTFSSQITAIIPHQIPTPPQRSGEFWEEPALVIGTWCPGVPERIITVAMDHDVIESRIVHLSDPTYVPDFQTDFFEIPNEVLGPRKYSRIVFQGVCPLPPIMGGKSCSAVSDYQKSIHPRMVARKLYELISQKSGYVFFRNCNENVGKDGVVDKEQRQKFIQIFEKEGFELVNRFQAPLRLTQASPGEDIPDPRPYPGKWESQNGGMIFFKRAYS